MLNNLSITLLLCVAEVHVVNKYKDIIDPRSTFGGNDIDSLWIWQAQTAYRA